MTSPAEAEAREPWLVFGIDPFALDDGCDDLTSPGVDGGLIAHFDPAGRLEAIEGAHSAGGSDLAPLLLLHTLEPLLDPEDRAALHLVVDLALAGRQLRQVRRLSRSSRVVDFSAFPRRRAGEVVGASIVARDVTTLDLSDARHEGLRGRIFTAARPIVEIEPDGTICSANRSWGELVGLDVEETTGRSLLDFVERADHELLVRRLVDRLLGAPTPATLRCRLGGRSVTARAVIFRMFGAYEHPAAPLRLFVSAEDFARLDR